MRLRTASSIGFNAAARRSFARSSQPFVTPARPSSLMLLNKSKLYQNSRRTYADAAPAKTPAKKPRKFRFFKTIWRLTYLSAIAGAAYLAYGVYELRHPEAQFEPDPNKKTLVILGKNAIKLGLMPSNDC
jgi:NADH:ubiquinone reductase (non-electrogenic)